MPQLSARCARGSPTIPARLRTVLVDRQLLLTNFQKTYLAMSRYLSDRQAPLASYRAAIIRVSIPLDMIVLGHAYEVELFIAVCRHDRVCP